MGQLPTDFSQSQFLPHEGAFISHFHHPRISYKITFCGDIISYIPVTEADPLNSVSRLPHLLFKMPVRF